MGQLPESDIGSYPLRHFTVGIRSTSQVAANTTPAVRLAVDSHATDVLQPGMQRNKYMVTVHQMGASIRPSPCTRAGSGAPAERLTCVIQTAAGITSSDDGNEPGDPVNRFRFQNLSDAVKLTRCASRSLAVPVASPAVRLTGIRDGAGMIFAQIEIGETGQIGSEHLSDPCTPAVDPCRRGEPAGAVVPAPEAYKAAAAGDRHGNVAVAAVSIAQLPADTESPAICLAALQESAEETGTGAASRQGNETPLRFNGLRFTGAAGFLRG